MLFLQAFLVFSLLRSPRSVAAWPHLFGGGAKKEVAPQSSSSWHLFGGGGKGTHTKPSSSEDKGGNNYFGGKKQQNGGGAQYLIFGAIASAFAVSARQTMGLFVNRARRSIEANLWTLVEVSDLDDPKLYKAVVRWLHARQFLKSGSYKAVSSVGDSKKQQKRRGFFKSADDVTFVPVTISGDGANFTYRNRRVWVRLQGAGESGDPLRSVVASMRPGAARRAAKANAGRPPKVILSTLGDGLEAIGELLKDAMGEADAEDQKHVEVYELSSANSKWELSCLVHKRSAESVVLKAGQLDDILGDVHTFIQDEAWYRERSLPHRRGYLLYGPPGSGKSSCILAVASHFGLPLCSLSLERLGKNTPLSEALGSAPPSSVLCIEDIDVAYAASAPSSLSRSDQQNGNSRTVVSAPAENAQSLHELLNAIDGVASQDGRLLFLTTNNLEALDPALVRPGRCDRTFYLGNATEEMAERLFRSFYRTGPRLRRTPSTKEEEGAAANGELSGLPDGGEDGRGSATTTTPEEEKNIDRLAPIFASSASSKSMAELQGHLLRHKDDPEAATESIVAAEAAGAPETTASRSS